MAKRDFAKIEEFMVELFWTVQVYRNKIPLISSRSLSMGRFCFWVFSVGVVSLGIVSCYTLVVTRQSKCEFFLIVILSCLNSGKIQQVSLKFHFLVPNYCLELTLWLFVPIFSISLRTINICIVILEKHCMCVLCVDCGDGGKKHISLSGILQAERNL